VIALAALVAPPLEALRSRRRPVTIVAGVLVVVVTAVFAYEYRQARADLADTRTRLEAARADLADARTQVDRTQVRADLTRDTVDLIQSETDFAVATRELVEAVIRETTTEIADVDALQREIDLQRMAVAADSSETQACFDGVARAVDANGRGDSDAAVDALRDASGPCAGTLALATGARFPYDFADPFVLRAGDSDAAVDALRDASGPCAGTLALATGARFPYDFADPYVLRAGDGRWYGYSTNAGAGDVQVIRSTDLQTWELVGNGLAALPAWASPGATWAPAVLARDGHYVLYYTAREASSHLQCISRAVAPSPAGPFLDDSTAPLVCQHEYGGSIDPSPFVDADGRLSLLWKSEGGGRAPTIWSQELAPDGRSLAFVPARPLVTVDRAFEYGVVEAPTLLREGGRYFLLYAGGDWSSRTYSAAYAVCAGPAGPCTKPADGRMLRSGHKLAGPGGVEVFRDAAGAPWVAFHAYSEPNVGYPSSRYFHVARLRVTGDGLAVDVAT